MSTFEDSDEQQTFILELIPRDETQSKRGGILNMTEHMNRFPSASISPCRVSPYHPQSIHRERSEGNYQARRELSVSNSVIAPNATNLMRSGSRGTATHSSSTQPLPRSILEALDMVLEEEGVAETTSYLLSALLTTSENDGLIHVVPSSSTAVSERSNLHGSELSQNTSAFTTCLPEERFWFMRLVRDLVARSYQLSAAMEHMLQRDRLISMRTVHLRDEVEKDIPTSTLMYTESIRSARNRARERLALNHGGDLATLSALTARLESEYEASSRRYTVASQRIADREANLEALQTRYVQLGQKLRSLEAARCLEQFRLLKFSENMTDWMNKVGPVTTVVSVLPLVPPSLPREDGTELKHLAASRERSSHRSVGPFAVSDPEMDYLSPGSATPVQYSDEGSPSTSGDGIWIQRFTTTGRGKITQKGSLVRYGRSLSGSVSKVSAHAQGSFGRSHSVQHPTTSVGHGAPIAPTKSKDATYRSSSAALASSMRSFDAIWAEPYDTERVHPGSTYTSTSVPFTSGVIRKGGIAKYSQKKVGTRAVRSPSTAQDSLFGRSYPPKFTRSQTTQEARAPTKSPASPGFTVQRNELDDPAVKPVQKKGRNSAASTQGSAAIGRKMSGSVHLKHDASRSSDRRSLLSSPLSSSFKRQIDRMQRHMKFSSVYPEVVSKVTRDPFKRSSSRHTTTTTGSATRSAPSTEAKQSTTHSSVPGRTGQQQTKPTPMVYHSLTSARRLYLALERKSQGSYVSGPDEPTTDTGTRKKTTRKSSPPANRTYCGRSASTYI